MKITKQDKHLLFEQELFSLLFIVLLGVAFHVWQARNEFYLIALNVGFIFYFWMIYEEKVHETGRKHEYFEHTSSYIMIAQTALALQLVSREMVWPFVLLICMVISVIMYSVALSRIVTYKLAFRSDPAEPVDAPVKKAKRR